MASESGGYIPPTTVAELLRRYAAGERRFPDCDLDEADLSGVTLAGAVFDRGWFHSARFDGADLRGAIFRMCSVRFASFLGADLRGALFRRSAAEAAEFEGARVDGTRFEGGGCSRPAPRDAGGLPHR